MVFIIGDIVYKRRFVVIFGLTIFYLTGCATGTYNQGGNNSILTDTAVGAGLGAVTGAIINGGDGAATGAAVGGAGGLLYNLMKRNQQPQGQYPQGYPQQRYYPNQPYRY